MVRVANVVLRQRGGATTKEAVGAPVKGAELKVTAAPVPAPEEPEATEEATTETVPEVSADVDAEDATKAEADPAGLETTPARTKRAARRISADKTGKKEVRKAERVDKKEVRQDKRDTKKVAKKEARKEANDAKKEARAAAAAEKKDKAAAAAENPESPGYFARLLSWGRGSPKKDGQEKAEGVESSDDDDEETQVEEAAGARTQDPSVEPADELYVVNDIPIRMTVTQPQPIAAC